jgi:outer membrane protein assembly factor BamB
MVWQFAHPLPEGIGKFLCCDLGNRGAALYQDEVYFTTPDAHVIALERDTGKVVWDVVMGDWTKAYTMTVAPLVVKGKVVVGMSGAEYPTRLYIAALDSEAGSEVRRRYTIPAPGEPGHDTWGEGDVGTENAKYGGGSGLDHRLLRSAARHALLEYRQPQSRLGRHRSQGRQPVHQLHSRAQPGYRHHQIRLPVHAVGRVGEAGAVK